MSSAALVGKLLLLTTVVMTSSCALRQDPENKEELQKAALNRWTGCIERHQDMTDLLETSPIKRLEAVNARCEGHQRDVLAAFPVHLENQIDSLLSKRSDNITAEHFLRSSNPATRKILESTQVDTLNQRIPSAQPEDL